MIQKLIPVNGILNMALKFGLLRKPLELLASAFKLVDGKKSELGIVAVVAIYGAAFFGAIPWAQAHDLAALAGGATATAIAERIKKHEDIIKKVSAEAAEAAKKP